MFMLLVLLHCGFSAGVHVVGVVTLWLVLVFMLLGLSHCG